MKKQYSLETKKTVDNWIQVGVYLTLSTFISCAGKASTFLECESRDIKTCKNEITKGEAIVKLAKNPKAAIIKIDFVNLNLDKGTLKNDNK